MTKSNTSIAAPISLPPSIVWNMSRNIETKDGIIYQIYQIVRHNDTLPEQEDEDPSEKVWTALVQRTFIWLTAASDFFNGRNNEDATLMNLAEDEIVRLPARANEANITVWGQVIDSSGRTITLTVTDQTNIRTILPGLHHAVSAYDTTTDMSAADYDTNLFGKMPIRGIGLKNQSAKLDRKGSEAADKPVENFTQCATIKGVDDLPLNTTFATPIWFIKKSNDGKLLTLYGYQSDGNQGVVAKEGEVDSLYVYRDASAVAELALVLKQQGINMDDKDTREIKFETPISFVATKLESARGKVWYKALRFDLPTK